MGKSKKKRRDSDLKLGYSVIYDYGDAPSGNSRKKKKKVSKASFAAEDKEWAEVSALELRKLMLQGWKTNNFLSHYGVTLTQLYQKLRFGWKLQD